ncbi:MAG: hypothetical protein NWP95_05805, partial [Pontimonas sp.]|nr:hypothetical protein [Pontimonas sp.]
MGSAERGNRSTVFVAVMGAVALAVGVAFQTAFPPDPRTLIVLGNSGGTSAETWDEMSFAVDYDYIPGPGLSNAEGSGRVYKLSLQGNPLDLLTELGSVYGIEGVSGPSQYFDEQWPGYVLGPEDWSGPTLNLTWSGTGPWYYSNP